MSAELIVDDADFDPQVDAAPGPDSPAAVAARARVDQQALWSVAVGLPALISVLRLWVEAGGDLQTTLLLVANVSSINLIAALIVMAAWLVSASMVAVFAIGQLTKDVLPEHPVPRPWRLRFARIAAGTPAPLKLVVFAFAALTWQLMFLPLLLVAAAMVFGLPPQRWYRWLTYLVGYLLLTGPTMLAALDKGDVLPVLVILAPIVLLPLGAARPVPVSLALPYARLAQALTAALVLHAASTVIAAPVLPLSVLTVTSAHPDAKEVDPRPLSVRGYVIEVNDATTAVLHEHGGVEFIPNARVTSRVLCPDSSQTPNYQLAVRGMHIEDSLLQAIGRHRRPNEGIDPACRSTGGPADVTP